MKTSAAVLVPSRGTRIRESLRAEEKRAGKHGRKRPAPSRDPSPHHTPSPPRPGAAKTLSKADRIYTESTPNLCRPQNRGFHPSHSAGPGRPIFRCHPDAPASSWGAKGAPLVSPSSLPRNPRLLPEEPASFNDVCRSWHLVDFHQRHAARAARAADLHRVAATGERREQHGVFGARVQRERAYQRKCVAQRQAAAPIVVLA